MVDDDSTADPGPNRQREIYLEGLFGETPDIPIRFEDLEAAALSALDDPAYDYVAGGAGGEAAMAHNRAAFEQWRLQPRLPNDVADRDLTVDVLGQTIPAPVLLAPVGVQSILHEDAEMGTARAGADLGLPVVLSSAASATLEDVADCLGTAPGWFQLYWPSDRNVAESFVDRAEAAGYDALVVTVDTPMLAWRERDLDAAYLPFLDGEGVANYFADPAFRDRLDAPPDADEFAAIEEFVEVFGDPSLTVDDIEWLCDRTSLPVVVKGVLHGGDAARLVDAGAAGVWVSNHGGRQVDRAVAALDALPAVTAAVPAETTVLFDSGVRRGADVLTAIALGADAVAIGRPYAYGLAIDGEDGVRAVCENLLADLDLTLGLCGRRSITAVDRDLLVRAGPLA